MQKGLLFLLVIFISAASTRQSIAASPQNQTPVKAEVSSEALTKADSLYAARQYTQAFSLYRSLFEKREYSPAMLLKMAYIQEGLDHLGESLFYLHVYFLATDDHQALKKMEELARKNNLEGYEESETLKIRNWLHEHYDLLTASIASVAIFFFALLLYFRMRLHTRPFFALFGLYFTLVFLFIHINFSRRESRGIIAQPDTYLMSGPSSGADVVTIIGEGHQLEIAGKQDVWLKVKWKDREVYIRENLIRTVIL